MVAKDVTPKEIEWTWPGRIPKGKVTLIAGFPNQGKSQITLNIASIVSRGGAWPNNEGNAEQGAVIIMSTEDTTDDVIVPRLIAAGADMDQVIIVRPMVRYIKDGKKKVRTFNLEDDLRNLRATIKYEAEVNGRIVRLVIFDPLNAYFGRKDQTDAHNAADVRALMTPLSDWVGEQNISLLGISHFNKGGNAHTLYRVSDSGAVTAVARAVWFAMKDAKSGQKMLLNGKNNLAAEQSGLTYEIEEGEWKPGKTAPRIVWQGSTDVTPEQALGERKERDDSALEKAEIWLLELLRDGPVESAIVFDGQKANNFSKPTLDRAKMSLNIRCYRKGGVGNRGKWYWELPEPADDFPDDEADYDFG